MTKPSKAEEPLTIVCRVTKQPLGGHEYTVLYDNDGNKYLKLEKFELKTNTPVLKDTDINTGPSWSTVTKALYDK